MAQALRVFWTSFVLGWENESNWVWRPVYFLYTAARPFAMCLTLYFLFRVKTQNPGDDPTFAAVYISNAFFTIFMAVSAGIGWVVIEDRELYRIIKYIFIAPIRFSLYIFGRAMLVLTVAVFTTIVIVLFGLFVLKLPIEASSMRWGMLGASFILGLVSTASLGMMMAGFVLLTARHSTLLAEGLGGGFLLLCGVIYPVDFLPGFWQIVAQGLPLTYWMEATRRAFGLAPFGEIMAGYSDLQLMFALAGFAAVFVVGAMVLFRLAANTAKKYGKIDQTTHY